MFESRNPFSNHGNGIKRKIYSVSELNTGIKELLEENYPFVWLTGEISNFRIPASGHFYFSLKDETSQISAVMFRGQQRQLKFEPEDGMNVTGMGRISVYEPRGTYQIILEYLEPSGVGALQMAFDGPEFSAIPPAESIRVRVWMWPHVCSAPPALRAPHKQSHGAWLPAGTPVS